MPNPLCDENYCRSAVLPYSDAQIDPSEFTPAIPKAQAWVGAFVSPVITQKAIAVTALDDSSPLKLCVAMFACFFVARSKFVQRGPNKNEWITELRTDANKLLEEIKRNPAKALGIDPVTGVPMQVGSASMSTMGLQSSKEGIVPTGTLLSETQWRIDPNELQREANQRGGGGGGY